MFKLSVHQIQQREQEYPHDIDKVPVKPGHLDHAGMLRAELADERPEQNDDENNQPAENVQGVEAGHGEVARRPQVAVRDRMRQVQVWGSRSFSDAPWRASAVYLVVVFQDALVEFVLRAFRLVGWLNVVRPTMRSLIFLGVGFSMRREQFGALLLGLV